MKKTVLSLAMVLAATFAFGQELTKEELKQQKREIKALMGVVGDAEMNIAKDPEAAAAAVKTALNSPLVNKDAYVWYVSASAKVGVMNNENRKRAEGAPFDEEKLYNYTYEFGNDIAECDKYDNMPDAKGKIKPRYTEFVNMSYGQQFGQFYNAGAYYYGQENYEKAYYLFKMFIDASDKLYKAGIIGKDTVNVPVAAYNMSLCGMQIKNYDMVLSHVDMAMAHPDFASSAFRYKTAAYLEKGDTATWLNLCKEGTVKFPKDAYFNQALIQYYDNKGENDKLDALADELIASDPQNPLFVYLKGYIAQSKYERKEQKEQLDVAIEWYKKTLDVDGNYETALANLGRCYLLKAQAYSNEQSSTKITDKKKLAQDKEVLNGFYNEALPLYEKLRSIVPDKKEFWFNGLMNCYYNLNMEDKVAELEKLMPEE
jgi:tetratricopeptide (TPR) repeat protein